MLEHTSGLPYLWRLFRDCFLKWVTFEERPPLVMFRRESGWCKGLGAGKNHFHLTWLQLIEARTKQLFAADRTGDGI